MSNPADRARLLVEDACDEFLQNADRARNMKVVEFCNFFLFGEKNQTTMATQQLQEFFRSANPKNMDHAAEYVSSYRFGELVDCLLAKYNACPEGWQQQRALYAEVGRSICHVLKAPDLKVVTLALALLSTLCTECHRAHNRFLLEALFADDLLRQARALWKVHHGRRGHYSVAIAEGVLRWVQVWRDELVPSSQRKRRHGHDPANRTQWSLASLQSSLRSYSAMSHAQLHAAAQSGAHWLDKRLKELSYDLTGEAAAGAADRGLFSALEECHYKLKRRGAVFPEVDFSSSGLRGGSFDIQRCSDGAAEGAAAGGAAGGAAGAAGAVAVARERPGAASTWDAFAPNESPSSVAEPVVAAEEPTSSLKITIKPAAVQGSGSKKQAGAFLAPPPSSPAKFAAPPQTQSTLVPVAAVPTATPTAAATFDFLNFDAGAAEPAGNPFGDDFEAGNPFHEPKPAAASPVVVDDPFAALAMRNC